MQSKGAVEILTLIITVFTLSGGMLGGLVTQGKISETVNYATGPVNEVLNAKTKKEIYKKNIKKELEFAHNNVAYQIGQEGGTLEWGKDVPEIDEIKEKFKQQLISHEYNIKDQNRIKGCIPPAISQENLSILSENTLELDFQEAWIRCTGKDSKVFLPIGEVFTVGNDENNYLHLAKYARALSLEIQNNIPDSGTGNSDITVCEDDSSSGEDLAKETAISEAKEEALGGEPDIGSEAFSNTESERNSYVELEDSNTVLEGDEEIESVDKDSDGCSDDSEAEYSVEAEFVADSVSVDVTLKDTGNTVITFDGEKNLEFTFEYAQPLE